MLFGSTSRKVFQRSANLNHNEGMSFIDNLRAFLAYAGDVDNETLESFYDRADKQDQFRTPVRNAKPADVPEGRIPAERQPSLNRYHPELPEYWSAEDYDIVRQDDSGEWYSTINSIARIYRDSNGNFVGLDTPMQSYVFSPEEDGLAKITDILDKMQEDGRTKIVFKGRIKNPSNPDTPMMRNI